MLKESAAKRMEYLRDYMNTAKKAKEIIQGKYKDARVFVFGSVVKGRYTASSDIDLLMVLDLNADERAQLMASVFMSMPDAPIELHIASEKELHD
ncbi:MAG: nucleotidyltransferase domain-containing protein [Nitrososphaerota archaeon]|nr:nucleotidyltransferase domain-containing protein [Nitrososphaerota archaeon]